MTVPGTSAERGNSVAFAVFERRSSSVLFDAGIIALPILGATLYIFSGTPASCLSLA
jgi:hypothetical protein